MRTCVSTVLLVSSLLAGPLHGAEAADVSPAPPVIPDAVFSLADYGGVPDGITSNTPAFRAAVAAVSHAGGGTLTVPRGTYLTGAINLCSGLNLHLAEGAVILFSSDPKEYASQAPRLHPELGAADLHDVMISGAGIFDGQGATWWPDARARRDPLTGRQVVGSSPRPLLLAFSKCQRVRIEGVTLRNAPMFNLGISASDDVAVEGLTILNPPDSPNTDGIDPKGSRRVRIAHCRIDTGDDCIALGSSAGQLEEDVLVTDCAFLHGHGCSIGSGTGGGVRNVTVRRCTFDGTESGVRLKSARGRGGLTENLVYEDLAMTRVGHPISINSHYSGTTTDVGGLGVIAPLPVTAGSLTPAWKHILIRNLSATGGAVDAGLILGLPEIPAEDIVLRHVSIEAPKGLVIAYAKNVTLDDVHIKAQEGPPVVVADTVEGLQHRGTPGFEASPR